MDWERPGLVAESRFAHLVHRSNAGEVIDKNVGRR